MDGAPLVLSVMSDDPFAIDVAHHLQQAEEISDIIALKQFANSEFCPRFIRDENEFDNIGDGLRGKTIVIVSTCCGDQSRNALAMRTCLVARSAKDNGAARVILVEPDLFFSAQDRGPRLEHGEVAFARTASDFKKFDGQPFSALLYAELLRTSGVDGVVTIHNHSISVQRVFGREFQGEFQNLSPAELYADYLMRQGMRDAGDIVVCAPDAGAAPFVLQVHGALTQLTERMLLKPSPSVLLIDKARTGERSVSVAVSAASPTPLAALDGRTVVVFDDMVRTGRTIVETCKLLKEAGAARVVFVVTHFYSSDEVKENLNHGAIDEIVTTNTLPTVLNRDMQGRLRRKMLVLKIEAWVARFLQTWLCGMPAPRGGPAYAVDISSKNPRWRPSHALQDRD